jgi:predicted alpha/beta-fold hydrolase
LRRDFEPIFKNPHLLTIAGNFWPRKIDLLRFPCVRREYAIDESARIVALEHQPQACARGHILFLHGLEGSANAGYIQSMAQAALERGFGVHRLNMRTCGGTESLCRTAYHSGLTADPLLVLNSLRARALGPLFVVGFSLGGNVALKLAGELGESDLVAGFCAVSTPVDLAACVRAMDKPSNRLYSRRFVRRLCARVARMSHFAPAVYKANALTSIRTIWEFDDRFTAPLFGFGDAENYYFTQSSIRFLHAIRTPTLVITAQDDPLVPFAIYNHPAFTENPAIQLVAPKFGGHLGFLSRRRPRFWLDGIVLDWIAKLAPGANRGTNPRPSTSLQETAC